MQFCNFGWGCWEKNWEWPHPGPPSFGWGAAFELRPLLGCTAAMPVPGHVPRWSCSQPWPTDLFFCFHLRPALLLWTWQVITRFLSAPGPNLSHSELSLVLFALFIRENRSLWLLGIWRIESSFTGVFPPLCYTIKFLIPSCILVLTNPRELSHTQLFIYYYTNYLWSCYNL